MMTRYSAYIEVDNLSLEQADAIRDFLQATGDVIKFGFPDATIAVN